MNKLRKRAVIIDDEQSAIESLIILIKKYCPDIEVVASASSIEDGIKTVMAYDPDILFLDIEMREGSGFEVVDKTQHMTYKLIFTTAYEQYALKALKVQAYDYLLKPIDIDDLKNAISKVRHDDDATVPVSQLSKLFNDKQPAKQTKIPVPAADGCVFLDAHKIVHLKADSNYTHIFLEGEKPMLVSKTLKELEMLLDQDQFMRIHNSHTINTQHIQKYIKSDGGSVLMSNGNHLPISRNKKQQLMQFFNMQKTH